MARKLLCIILGIVTICACTSCEKAFMVNVVRFTREGGTQVVPSCTYTISISDYDGNYGSGGVDGPGEGDEVEINIEWAELDWLKAELNHQTGVVTVTAQRNDTGKRRKLYLDGMKGDIGSSVPVIQEK